MRLVGLLLGLIGLAVALSVLYLFIALPDAGQPLALQATPTPERLARGAYLANHVTVCIDCHSERDWSYYSGPIKAGTEGMGGERFGPEMGLPGTLYARNITPAGIGTWTDGEIARAITSGVNRDGHPFFPLMPYPAYNNLGDEDLLSIVAYIRSLAPIEHEVPASQLDFPMNLIVRTIPTQYFLHAAPDRANKVAYGEYLVAIAGCGECHTPAEKGTPLPGMTLAGGFEFPLPDGSVVRSANITPDPKTGLGAWSEELFVQRFKSYDSEQMRRLPVRKGQGNTIMPWTMYAGMTREDLSAIYAYLRTVQPVSHAVEKWSTP